MTEDEGLVMMEKGVKEQLQNKLQDNLIFADIIISQIIYNQIQPSSQVNTYTQKKGLKFYLLVSAALVRRPDFVK